MKYIKSGSSDNFVSRPKYYLLCTRAVWRGSWWWGGVGGKVRGSCGLSQLVEYINTSIFTLGLLGMNIQTAQSEPSRASSTPAAVNPFTMSDASRLQL